MLIIGSTPAKAPSSSFEAMHTHKVGQAPLPGIKAARDTQRASKSSAAHATSRRRSSHTIIHAGANASSLAQKLKGRRRSSRLMELNTLKAQLAHLNVDFGGCSATASTGAGAAAAAAGKQKTAVAVAAAWTAPNSPPSSRPGSAVRRRSKAMSMTELCEHHRARTSSTTATLEQAKWDSALTEARDRYAVTRDISTASENMRRLAKEHSQRGMGRAGRGSALTAMQSPADVIRARNAHAAARRRALGSQAGGAGAGGGGPWRARRNSNSNSSMLALPGM